MTTRIDTVRNRLVGLADLATKVAAEVDTLHLLAYDRHHARAERVRGGQPDYALDNHGDPKARAALSRLSVASIDAAKIFETEADAAIELLRTGPSPTPKRGREITAIELADALIAQARRVQRGDYTPARRTPQLEQLQALGALKREVEKLRRDLIDARKREVELERQLAARDDDRRSRSARHQLATTWDPSKS